GRDCPSRRRGTAYFAAGRRFGRSSMSSPRSRGSRDARHRRARGASVKLDAVADRSEQILAALSQVIVGKADVLRQILAGVLANGHILIEDYPGLAKTLIARLIAQSVSLGFKRIQFTPDLLPSDITGSFLFNQREGQFEFRPGPIFTNLLLADEI